MYPLITLLPGAVQPTYGSDGAIGMDLYANIDAIDFLPIPGGGRLLIPTGVKIIIPDGFYGRIAPRSGLAFKNGIDVLAGVIDTDYRGEIGVILHNTSEHVFRVNKHDRIAQLIFERAQRLYPVVLTEAQFAERSTARGAGGFGSTGVAK